AGSTLTGGRRAPSPDESMRPECVALPTNERALGKHSGRHALRQRVVELGYHLDEAQLQKVFDGFKALADRKKTIYNADIEALAEAQIHKGPAVWTLEAVAYKPGPAPTPSAGVRLRLPGSRLQE